MLPPDIINQFVKSLPGKVKMGSLKEINTWTANKLNNAIEQKKTWVSIERSQCSAPLFHKKH